jgi:hypothetical protein
LKDRGYKRSGQIGYNGLYHNTVLIDLLPETLQGFHTLPLADINNLSIKKIDYNGFVDMSFGYCKFIDTDIFKIIKLGAPVIPLKMFLLDLLDCIPTHMKEISDILDCTDMGKGQY